MDRRWARWTIHFHHLIHVAMFVVLASGAIGAGFYALQRAREESRNPLSDPTVLGMLPLVAFAMLVMVVLARVAMRKMKQPRTDQHASASGEYFHKRFEADGFTTVASHLREHELAALRSASDRLQQAHPKTRAGIRDPLSLSPDFEAAERQLRPLAEALMGRLLMPVRSILFDKTPETNWDVMWHQDVTIAVRERIDIEGFGPWSVKQGLTSVQPPASVLEQMITLRLHLDDCPADNGPLLVVPGSHLDGFVDVRTLDTAACAEEAFACIAAAGEVLAMRPLLLHASKRSQTPVHRRVLHIDYAADPLPAGLQWASMATIDSKER